MKQEDLERLKDLCAKEGFDLIKQDGRYYVEQARNRIIDAELKVFDSKSYFSFQVSKHDEIKYLKDELEAYLTHHLEKFLNGETESKVITYPPNATSTR